MLVTNQTAQDYWFGPLHLLGGVGQTLTVDDTTATSLYLTEDAVADAINNLYLAGKITVSSAAAPFPRPTGVPQLLHGDGSPEGLVFAPQGSMYMRRDGSGANSLYTKTTGVTLNTGWQNFTTAQTGPGTTYRKTTSKTVNTTTAETDLLNGEISIGASVLGTAGLLRLTLIGLDFKNNSGGNVNFRWRLKFGATTVFDTGNFQIQTGANRGPIAFQAVCLNTATNAQDWSGFVAGMYSANNLLPASLLTVGEGTLSSSTVSPMSWQNTSAEDTTTAKALVFSVQMDVSNANAEVKLLGALVEII
jgi:hypothetical protein